MSIDGRKIPYLNKAMIFKYIKSLAKSKKVAFCIHHIYERNIIPVICEFDSNASISVTVEFNKIYRMTIINNIIKESVNYIIDNLTSTLEQSGYKLS